MRTEKPRKTLVILEILIILTICMNIASATISPPTNVHATLSGTTLTVGWTKSISTNVTQYRIHVYNTTGSNNTIIDSLSKSVDANTTVTTVIVPSASNCYKAHVYALAGTIMSSSIVSNVTCNTTVVPDILPPGSITGLKNVSYAQSYIIWTWTNPLDPDFSKVMVYIDGLFVTNVSSGNSYNATGLSNGSTHSIGTHTVDTSGNINNTWVNNTRTTASDIIPVLDTVPPGSITGLKNVSYAQNYIIWTWTNPTDPDFSQVMVYIDGLFVTNVSSGNSYNATGLDPSTFYKISVYTVDASGNINSTEINDTEITAPFTSPPITPGSLVASLTNIVLTVSANGGTPPYTYNWTGVPSLPVPCSGINTSTITCNPTIPGTYNLTVTITDKNGNVTTISNDIRENSPIAQVLTGAVTGLNSTKYAQDYINWTWVNPVDPGFGHVDMFVDNGPIINVSNNGYYNETGLIPNTKHTIHVRAVDINGNANLTWVNSTRITAKDKTPPDSISSLNNVSYAPDYIDWKWTNPSNKDFDHVDVYINGIFGGSVSSGTGDYIAIGLNPGASYKISTHTVDTSGNINATWVNNTRMTANVSGGTIIQGSNIRFVTIGDPHLGDIPDGTANLTLAANYLKGRNKGFDFVVVVGDYHNLTSAKNILSGIGKPYYLVKGNHDGLTLCNTSSFGDNVSNAAGYQLIFVGICGINPGQSILTKSYDKNLPSIVFAHLPSACLSSWNSYYDTGCGFVDTLGINAGKLLGVYSGHIHEYSNQIINGTLYITEDNLGGNGVASDYIGYTMIQNATVNYERLYYR